MLNVAGSMSTRRGVAPTRTIDAGGGEEGERRRDDLVAGSDAERHQRDEQGVGARRDADRRACTPSTARELTLEAVDLGPPDEPLAVADPGDGGEDLVAQRTVLRLEIEKRDAHARAGCQRVTISGAPQSGRSLRLSALPGGALAGVEDDLHVFAGVRGQIDRDRDPLPLRLIRVRIRRACVNSCSNARPSETPTKKYTPLPSFVHASGFSPSDTFNQPSSGMRAWK